MINLGSLAEGHFRVLSDLCSLRWLSVEVRATLGGFWPHEEFTLPDLPQLKVLELRVAKTALVDEDVPPSFVWKLSGPLPSLRRLSLTGGAPHCFVALRDAATALPHLEVLTWSASIWSDMELELNSLDSQLAGARDSSYRLNETLRERLGGPSRCRSRRCTGRRPAEQLLDFWDGLRREFLARVTAALEVARQKAATNPLMMFE